MYKNSICDARFSKCCGGVTEVFNTCWEDKNYPYLSAVRDTKEEGVLPDLTQESEAEKWIRSTPDSFCRTHDKAIISQILNNYDQETTNFYRWKVRYTQEELAELIRSNTKIITENHRSYSSRTRKVGTYLQAENSRDRKNTHHWERAGNTPHTISYSFVQLSLYRRQGRNRCRRNTCMV